MDSLLPLPFASLTSLLGTVSGFKPDVRATILTRVHATALFAIASAADDVHRGGAELLSHDVPQRAARAFTSALLPPTRIIAGRLAVYGAVARAARSPDDVFAGRVLDIILFGPHGVSATDWTTLKELTREGRADAVAAASAYAQRMLPPIVAQLRTWRAERLAAHVARFANETEGSVFIDAVLDTLLRVRHTPADDAQAETLPAVAVAAPFVFPYLRGGRDVRVDDVARAVGRLRRVARMQGAAFPLPLAALHGMLVALGHRIGGANFLANVDSARALHVLVDSLARVADDDADFDDAFVRRFLRAIVEEAMVHGTELMRPIGIVTKHERGLRLADPFVLLARIAQTRGASWINLFVPPRYSDFPPAFRASLEREPTVDMFSFACRAVMVTLYTCAVHMPNAKPFTGGALFAPSWFIHATVPGAGHAMGLAPALPPAVSLLAMTPLAELANLVRGGKWIFGGDALDALGSGATDEFAPRGVKKSTTVLGLGKASFPRLPLWLLRFVWARVRAEDQGGRISDNGRNANARWYAQRTQNADFVIDRYLAEHARISPVGTAPRTLLYGFIYARAALTTNRPRLKAMQTIGNRPLALAADGAPVTSAVVSAGEKALAEDPSALALLLRMIGAAPEDLDRLCGTSFAITRRPLYMLAELRRLVHVPSEVVTDYETRFAAALDDVELLALNRDVVGPFAVAIESQGEMPAFSAAFLGGEMPPRESEQENEVQEYGLIDESEDESDGEMPAFSAAFLGGQLPPRESERENEVQEYGHVDQSEDESDGVFDDESDDGLYDEYDDDTDG
jgi:hypothetical protein